METASKFDHIERKTIARTREQLRLQSESAKLRSAQLLEECDRALRSVRAIVNDSDARAELEAAKVSFPSTRVCMHTHRQPYTYMQRRHALLYCFPRCT